jgi:NTP pyrophosphatase (non-canonical NTP hydrolase)
MATQPNGKPRVGEPSVFNDQARQALSDSERWFPDVAHSITHHTLGLAGEVGEFANLLKKIERGSLDYRDAAVRHKLMMELTDTYIYLLNIAGLLNVDLTKSYLYVRSENEKRFGVEALERAARVMKESPSVNE